MCWSIPDSSSRIFSIRVSDKSEKHVLPCQRGSSLLVARSWSPLVLHVRVHVAHHRLHVFSSTFCTSFVFPGRFYLSSFVNLTDRRPRTIDRYKFDRL